jgi:hypothetical protein
MLRCVCISAGLFGEIGRLGGSEPCSRQASFPGRRACAAKPGSGWPGLEVQPGPKHSRYTNHARNIQRIEEQIIMLQAHNNTTVVPMLAPGTRDPKNALQNRSFLLHCLAGVSISPPDNQQMQTPVSVFHDRLR